MIVAPAPSNASKEKGCSAAAGCDEEDDGKEEARDESGENEDQEAVVLLVPIVVFTLKIAAPRRKKGSPLVKAERIAYNFRGDGDRDFWYLSVVHSGPLKPHIYNDSHPSGGWWFRVKADALGAKYTDLQLRPEDEGKLWKRVDEQKHPAPFQAEDGLEVFHAWVQCSKCGKWRMLPAGLMAWDGDFECEYNDWDKKYNSCKKPQAKSESDEEAEAEAEEEEEEESSEDDSEDDEDGEEEEEGKASPNRTKNTKKRKKTQAKERKRKMGKPEVQNKSDNRFVCPKCDRLFLNIRGLRVHIGMQHPDMSDSAKARVLERSEAAASKQQRQRQMESPESAGKKQRLQRLLHAKKKKLKNLTVYVEQRRKQPWPRRITPECYTDGQPKPRRGERRRKSGTGSSSKGNGRGGSRGNGSPSWSSFSPLSSRASSFPSSSSSQPAAAEQPFSFEAFEGAGATIMLFSKHAFYQQLHHYALSDEHRALPE
eukprot:g2.t1